MNNDLISREALKEKINELIPRWNKITDYDMGRINSYEFVIKIIDNAPTVEYPFYAEAYQTGYEEGKNARPQGEWKEKVYTEKFGLGYLTHHDIICSVCGVSGEDDEGIPQNFKFCPNCGADMRKENDNGKS